MRRRKVVGNRRRGTPTPNGQTPTCPGLGLRSSPSSRPALANGRAVAVAHAHMRAWMASSLDLKMLASFIAVPSYLDCDESRPTHGRQISGCRNRRQALHAGIMG